MQAERTWVLALAAAIAWRRRDAESLVALRVMGLEGARLAYEDLARLRQEWPLGAQLLLAGYH